MLVLLSINANWIGDLLPNSFWRDSWLFYLWLFTLTVAIDSTLSLLLKCCDIFLWAFCELMFPQDYLLFGLWIHIFQLVWVSHCDCCPPTWVTPDIIAACPLLHHSNSNYFVATSSVVFHYHHLLPFSYFFNAIEFIQMLFYVHFQVFCGGLIRCHNISY